MERAYDVEGMNVGTIASGRIGLAVLKRMAPFDVNLHYTDRHRLPAEVEQQYNLTYVPPSPPHPPKDISSHHSTCG